MRYHTVVSWIIRGNRNTDAPENWDCSWEVGDVSRSITRQTGLVFKK